MLSPKRYKRFIIPLLVISVLVFFSAGLVRFSWSELINGFPKGFILIKMMIPPDWSAFPDMIRPAVETVVLALIATVIGSVLSIIFGLAAAKNISHPVLRNPMTKSVKCFKGKGHNCNHRAATTSYDITDC